MSTEKSERLLNLLIMLLVQRHYVAKDRIRRIVYGDSSSEAFEKMFERDKEELRSLGVPVELGQMDAYFGDEPGYRIRPDEFALPDIDLEPDEAAVVGLATKVWEHATLAKATTEAVRKLTAAGVDIDVTALEIAQPRLAAEEPSFDVFWEAICERTPLEFDYQRSGSRQGRPPGTSSRGGSPATPVAGTPSGSTPTVGPSASSGSRGCREPPARWASPGSYEIPADTDIKEVSRRLAPAPTSEPAVILARHGSAWPLRRSADTVEEGVTGPDDKTGWDRLVLSRGGVGLVEEVLGFGADVYVEESASLRDEVVGRLREAVS